MTTIKLLIPFLPFMTIFPRVLLLWELEKDMWGLDFSLFFQTHCAKLTLVHASMCVHRDMKHTGRLEGTKVP